MRKIRLMICYVSADKEIALRLAQMLQGKTYPDLDAEIDTIYMDKPGSGCGDDWSEWSIGTVLSSDIVLQIWTSATMRSDVAGVKVNDKFIREELKNARDAHKRIIILHTVDGNDFALGFRAFSLLSKDYFSDLFNMLAEDIERLYNIVYDRVYKIVHNKPIEYLAPASCLRTNDALGRSPDTFVGREEELQRIDELFKQGKRVVIISGDGGIGKTELVRRYVRRQFNEDAEGRLYCYKVCGNQHDLSLASVILSLQYDTDLSEEDKKLSEYDKACIRLGMMSDMDSRFILIIDNFNADFDSGDNKRLINKIIEKVPFRVMFSSRSHTRNTAVGEIRVGSLPLEEQKELFYSISGIVRNEQNDDKISVLSERIGGHTMTLELSAHLVAKKGYDVAEVSDHLLHSKGKVRCEHTDERKDITEHLVSLFELADMTEEQKGVLYYVSFFCHHGIASADLYDAFDDGEDDVDYLIDISLLKENKVSGALYLHPLVSAVANETYKDGRDAEMQSAIGYIKEKYKPDIGNDSFSTLEQDADYLRHLLSLLFGYADVDDDIFTVSIWLGDILRAIGYLADAFEYYQRCYKVAEQMIIEHSNAPDGAKCLSLSCDGLGDICRDFGDFDIALRYYQRSYELREQLMAQFGEPDCVRDLSISCDKIGNIYHRQGDLDKALEYCQRYYNLAEQYMKQSGINESKRNLSIACNVLGDIYYQTDLIKAFECYQQGFKLAEKLMEQLPSSKNVRDLSISYERLGNIFLKRGDIEKALEYYQKSYELRKPLMEQLDTPQISKDMFLSAYRLFSVTIGHERYDYLAEMVGYANLLKENGWDIDDKFGLIYRRIVQKEFNLADDEVQDKIDELLRRFEEIKDK